MEENTYFQPDEIKTKKYEKFQKQSLSQLSHAAFVLNLEMLMNIVKITPNSNHT